MISIIVAVSEDLGIGKNNELLWRIPEDMKRFKRLTSGKTVLMGRKTWESLPVKPLPGRRNIVITDIPHDCCIGAEIAYSVEEALDKCRQDEEVFVIGGGSIYNQFMPLANRLYITHIHKKSAADIFFPEIDRKLWKIIDKEEHISAEKDEIPYTYIIYERKKGND
jgi:dihydrofolate reductase